jgi:hypothetical protein
LIVEQALNRKPCLPTIFAQYTEQKSSRIPIERFCAMSKHFLPPLSPDDLPPKPTLLDGLYHVRLISYDSHVDCTPHASRLLSGNPPAALAPLYPLPASGEGT